MSVDERYNRLFEHCPEAVFRVDRDGHLVDCNTAACLLFARSREELLGEPILRWVLPGDRERAKKRFLKAFEEESQEWTLHVRRGDGLALRVWMRVAHAGEDEDGRPAVHVFARDAGSRRTALPVQEQLQNLLENLPGQFSVVLDAVGRVRHARGLARTHWHDDREWVGRDFDRLLDTDEDNRHRLEAMYRKVAQEGASWGGTLWNVRADGSRFPAEVFAVPHRNPKTNEVIGLLLVGRDISSEHESMEKLERAERLARIGELVASIGQELKRPVDRMGVSLRTVRTAELEPEDRQAVAAVLDDVIHLERLVEGLTAFAADVRLKRRDSNLSTIVQEVLDDDTSLEAAGIRVSSDLPADVPPLAMDVEQMRWVVRALLSNAREALEEKGGGAVHVEVRTSEGNVVLQVHDNGVGLEDSWRDKVFEPFFTTKSASIGLGLSIAQRIVEAHGGRVWVERARTGWTTFSVSLPLESAAGEGVSFRPVPLRLLRARTVLVVDDEESVRGMIRKVLEKVGYEVREAWSGRSAMAQIMSGDSPELIVTDLRMTDGTGYWFLQELEEDFPELLGRTVIITGDPSRSVQRMAKRLGCSVVSKPFEVHELLEALDEAVIRSG